MIYHRLLDNCKDDNILYTDEIYRNYYINIKYFVGCVYRVKET